jgi:hypothetical protein
VHLETDRHGFVTKSCVPGAHASGVSERLHPLLGQLIRKLASEAVSAAETRRTLGPVAAELRIAQPSYTTVLRLVREWRPDWSPPAPIGVVAPALEGRVASIRELEESRARALVHLERLRRGATRRGSA